MFNLDEFIYRVKNTVFVVTATMLCIPAPSSAQRQLQGLSRTCEAAVIELTGVPSSILRIRRVRGSVRRGESGGDKVQIKLTEPWKLPSGGTATNDIGYCESNSNGLIVNINTLMYSAQSSSDFQDFGEIPGTGRFLIIFRQSKSIIGGRLDKSPTKIYYSTIGQDEVGETNVFPVIVNGQRQMWWADCNDKYIGQLDANGTRALPLARNTFTEAVSKLVCAK